MGEPSNPVVDGANIALIRTTGEEPMDSWGVRPSTTSTELSSRRRTGAPRPGLRVPRASAAAWAVALVLVLITAAACTSSTSTPQPSGSPGVAVGGNGGANGGNGGGNDGGGNGGGNDGGGGNGAATQAPSATPSPGAGGPWVVRQTRHLGDETISGQVCSVTAPFNVTSVTSTITFTMAFVPTSPNQGTYSYAYSFPSLGESHSATGSYTIGPPTANGALSLAMSGSDHVVFNGFDGNIPFNYGFDLVPSAATGCPAS
jgi:hypothetical protein